MSDHQQPQGWDDVHALVGAYAVDALDDGERERFEAHLRQCADCRDEVASLQEAAALLGTDDVAPPTELRDQVLAGITTIRPLPPLSHDASGGAPVELAARRRRLRPFSSSRLPLLVAASVVLLAAVGGLLLRPWAGTDEGPLTATEQVLAAADATRYEQEFPDGSRATVVVSRSEGRAVILTEDMALAPEGKVYELWLQSPEGTMVPAGLMPDEPDTELLLEGDASEAKAVGITVEPDGGSDQPTSQPIAFFTLDS